MMRLVNSCSPAPTCHPLSVTPSACIMICLLHVSDVITKGLGLSFPLEPDSDCHPHVLETLGKTQQDIDSLRDSVGPAVMAQVKDMMKGV